MSWNRLALASVVVFVLATGGATELLAESTAESPDSVLNHIRSHVQQLLVGSGPELYRRHLESILALCEESVLKLKFAGPDREAQTKELTGYLKAIESGLNTDDAQKAETYLVQGRRSLNIARLSRSDDSLQLYTVSLPAHWQPQKAYPLYVQLHGRWSDLPLALVASTFGPQTDARESNNEAIVVVPSLRGNGKWRDENGSEPDVWEAIDDLKTFAKIDPDRLYISGHSWGGDDVWSIVLRTPDLWAAAGIMAGSAAGVPSELKLVANAQNEPTS